MEEPGKEFRWAGDGESVTISVNGDQYPRVISQARILSWAVRKAEKSRIIPNMRH